MRYMLACAFFLIASQAHAEVTVRKGQGTAAPTQPVAAANLEAPVFQSDTRNLEAILDKEETARVTVARAKAPAPAATMTVPAQPAPAPSAATPVSHSAEAPEEEDGILHSTLMSIRVFAIRWREVFDIFFTGVLAFYVRKLYTLSREQHKILSHSIRSAEYSAAAAKRSADICEILMKNHETPNADQHQFDL